MIQNEREIRHELVLQAARRMMTAARTAPKGKGYHRDSDGDGWGYLAPVR